MNNDNATIKKMLDERLESFNCAKEYFLQYYAYITKVEKEVHPEFTEDEQRVSMASAFGICIEPYFGISHESAMKVLKDIVYPLICVTRELESMGAIDVDSYLKKWEVENGEA